MFKAVNSILMVLTLAAGVLYAEESGKRLVIRAEDAAVKTAGGKVESGGWNLWSNGRIGQPVRIASAGKYQVIVKAWGSKAADIWPEMALLIDDDVVTNVAVQSQERTDYRFEIAVSKGTHEISVSFLNDALVGKEDRNLFVESITVIPPPGEGVPQLSDGSELLAEAGKREKEIVAGTEQAIEKVRKSDAVIKVVDSSGKPVRGAEVSAKQTGHEFLFGCNIYGFDRSDESLNLVYKHRFRDLFNYATVGFYWQWYEQKKGEPDYPYTDKVVAWCMENGIRMKGHPLLWGCESGVPSWSKGQPAPEIQKKRVEDIIGRYKGKICSWEVVNEASHLPEPKIDDPYRWARQADPTSCLIVNDYAVLENGYPPFFKLLKAAIDSGVPFDGIGIQAHEPRTARFPLDRVQRILDRYASLGKGLHITEFTPSSGGEKITGSHLAGVWDEAAQADYAVKFYRVCFAHPEVRGITWWDLSDKGSWLKGGGMLRQDMSPKPVYEQLKKLIQDEWSTRVSGKTGADGKFAFRGFRGTYRIAVEFKGKTVQKDFVLKKDDAREITVVLQQ